MGVYYGVRLVMDGRPANFVCSANEWQQRSTAQLPLPAAASPPLLARIDARSGALSPPAAAAAAAAGSFSLAAALLPPPPPPPPSTPRAARCSREALDASAARPFGAGAVGCSSSVPSGARGEAARSAVPRAALVATGRCVPRRAAPLLVPRVARGPGSAPIRASMLGGRRGRARPPCAFAGRARPPCAPAVHALPCCPCCPCAWHQVRGGGAFAVFGAALLGATES